MITGSKAAFAALVFADAFFQHGEEVFVGQIHRKPEALPEHVDHAVICQEDGVPTCDRVQIQFVRNAIHLIGIDVSMIYMYRQCLWLSMSLTYEDLLTMLKECISEYKRGKGRLTTGEYPTVPVA